MYVKDTFCETKHNLQKLGIVRQANIAGQLRFEGGTPTSQDTSCVRVFFAKKHNLQKLGKAQQTNIAWQLRFVGGTPTSQPRLRECPMLLLPFSLTWTPLLKYSWFCVSSICVSNICVLSAFVICSIFRSVWLKRPSRNIQDFVLLAYLFCWLCCKLFVGLFSYIKKLLTYMHLILRSQF